MNELKKCPFCGDTAYIQDWSIKTLGRERFSVACNRCEVATPVYSTKQVAIAAWNRRANSE